MRLKSGITVHVALGQAELLAQAGILKALCDHTVVTIDESDVSRMRCEVDRAAKNAGTKEQVERLLNYLSHGIDSGKFRAHVAKPPEIGNRPVPFELEELCLLDITDFAKNFNLPVSVDDRIFRQYQTVEHGAFFCDSWDIVHWLRTVDALSEEQFHDARSRMRAANLFYLPVTSDEITSALLRGQIRDGELRESPELVYLRRNAAESLAKTGTLQRPIRDSKGEALLREVLWPVRLNVSIIQALIDIWRKADLATDQPEILADWVWFNLWIDNRYFAEMSEKSASGYSPQRSIAEGIGSLFSLAIQFLPEQNQTHEQRSRRQRYFRWLMKRAVAPVQTNVPEFWDWVTEPIRKLFVHAHFRLKGLIEMKGPSDVETRSLKIAVGLFAADLPDRVAGALKLDVQVMRDFGVMDLSPSVMVAGNTFTFAGFWNAVAHAFCNGHGALDSADRKTRLRLRMNHKSQQVFISPKGPKMPVWRPLGISWLPLLSNNVDFREKTLRDEARYFDLDKPFLTEAIRDIARQKKPAERVARRDTYRLNSAFALCADLHYHLRQRQEVNIEELIPQNINILLRHMRLNLEDAQIRDFSQRLISAVGITETIIRLSHLPVPLPENVLAAWTKLTPDDRAIEVDVLKRRLVTPLERIALLELIWLPGDLNEELVAISRAQLEWLVDEKRGLRQGNAMLAAVRWAHLRLGWHPESRGWPSFVKLCVAWAHGCDTHKSFQWSGANPSTTETWFQENSQEFFAESFSNKDGIWLDAANPRRLKIATIILKGLASASRLLSAQQIDMVGLPQLLGPWIDSAALEDLSDVWADRSIGGNALCSFLAAVPDENLKHIVGELPFEARLGLVHRPSVEAALKVLLQNPDDGPSRNLLHFILAGHSPYPEFTSQVSALLKNIDLMGRFQTERLPCPQDIIFISQLVAELPDESLSDVVWEQCLRLAEHLASTSQRTVEREQLRAIADAISEAAIRLSAKAVNSEDGVRRATQRWIEITHLWPDFAKYCGMALAQGLTAIPADIQDGYWKWVTLVRACL
jgi:hypothetical protein